MRKVRKERNLFYYLQSRVPTVNGMAERAVQTVKQRLLKMFQEGQGLNDALAEIRTIPVSAVLPSSAVLLQGRNLRGSLPFAKSALKPKLVDASLVHRQLSLNRGSILGVGQTVRVRVEKKWLPEKLSSICQQQNSYVIRTTNGREYRRTRSAINVTTEKKDSLERLFARSTSSCFVKRWKTNK